jgi:hypothetical protein
LKRSANPSSWRNSRGRILSATYRSSPARRPCRPWPCRRVREGRGSGTPRTSCRKRGSRRVSPGAAQSNG